MMKELFKDLVVDYIPTFGILSISISSLFNVHSFLLTQQVKMRAVLSPMSAWLPTAVSRGGGQFL